MARIKIDVQGVINASGQINSAKTTVNTTREDLDWMMGQISSAVLNRNNLRQRLRNVSNSLAAVESRTNQIKSMVENGANSYQNTERSIVTRRASLNDKIDKKVVSGVGFGSLVAVDAVGQVELLSTVKTLLNGADKLGENDEAGVLKDVISYIEDFTSFWVGDKKGLTGASNWCKLADSSIGLWTGLYDYFQDMYDGIKTGFFGEVAQRNVGMLGLSSGILGLASSILSATNGLDNKQWQSIVADYVDCGKDILSVISSGYKLKNIGDIKSLAEMKAGPWNALGIYSAVGEAGIQSISQGFRSHEKYYADGQWDLGDTGATGIDISMAGIYGLSHKLTGGLDDLVYGVIDSATGGNGTSDMSYFEKAAEGYKILANKCGEAIGNWWISLTT